jgi:hypothetical protein
MTIIRMMIETGLIGAEMIIIITEGEIISKKEEEDISRIITEIIK